MLVRMPISLAFLVCRGGVPIGAGPTLERRHAPNEGRLRGEARGGTVGRRMISPISAHQVRWSVPRQGRWTLLGRDTPQPALLLHLDWRHLPRLLAPPSCSMAANCSSAVSTDNRLSATSFASMTKPAIWSGQAKSGDNGYGSAPPRRPRPRLVAPECGSSPACAPAGDDR